MACNTSRGNTGTNYCNPNTKSKNPTGIIFADKAATFSAADFLLEDSWIDMVKAQKVFPLVDRRTFGGIEDNSADAEIHEYDSGLRIKGKSKKHRFNFTYNVNECVEKELLKFRGYSGGVFFVYDEEVIKGKSTDGRTTYAPINVTFVDVEVTNAASDGTPASVVIMLDVSDKEFADYGVSAEMTWDVGELQGLTSVDLALVSASATSVVVSVGSSCGGTDSVDISGLGTDAADWTIGSGSITDVAESPSGTYTITGTSLAGDVNLADPANRSDSVLVISSGAVDTGL
jgi:hypothetical protein